MTYIVSGGALNSTNSTQPLLICVARVSYASIGSSPIKSLNKLALMLTSMTS